MPDMSKEDLIIENSKTVLDETMPQPNGQNNGQPNRLPDNGSRSAATSSLSGQTSRAPHPARAVAQSSSLADLFASGAPRVGVVLSLVWLIMSFTYLLTAMALGQSIGSSPSALGGVIAGLFAPVAVIWLVIGYVQRAMEVDTIVSPLSRQLNSLLAPGASADVRVRRVTQQLAEQVDHLRQAANIALEDSSAAMSALTRQSGELRRLSAEAMLEIGRVSKSAEQTLAGLQQSLSTINKDGSSEGARIEKLAAGYEARIKQAIEQVGQLAEGYEDKLSKLGALSEAIEGKARSLLNVSHGVTAQIEHTSGGVAGDLDRLETILAEVSQRSAAIAHQLSRPVDALETAATKLDHNMRQSHSMLAEAITNLASIGDTTIARASGLVSSLADRLGALELMGAKMVSVEASARSESSRLLTSISDVTKHIVEASEQTQGAIEQAVERFAVVGESTEQRVQAMADKLGEGAMRLEDAFASSQSTLAEQSRLMSDEADRLANTNASLKAQMEESRLLLDDASEQLAEQLAKMGADRASLTQQIADARQVTQALSEMNLSVQQRSEALSAVAQSARQMLQTAIDDVAAGVASGQETVETVSGKVQILSAAAQAVREEITRLGAEAKSSADGLDVMRAGLAAGMSAMVAQTVQDVAKMHKSGADVEQIKVALLQASTQSQQALDAMAKRTGEAQAQAETSIAALTSKLSNLLMQVETVAQQMQADAAGIIAHTDGAGEAAQRSSALFVDLKREINQMMQETSIAEQSLQVQAKQSADVLAQFGIQLVEATQLATKAQEISERTEQLASSTERARHVLVASSETLHSNAKLVDEASVQAAQSLQRTIAGLENLKSGAEQVTSSSDEAEGRIARLEATVARLENHLSALSNQSDMLGKAIDHHAVSADLATERLQKASGVLDNRLAEVSEQMLRFGGIAAAERQQMQDWLEAMMASTVTLDQTGSAVRATLEMVQHKLLSSEHILSMGGQNARHVLEAAAEQMQHAAQSLTAEAVSGAHSLSGVGQLMQQTHADFVAQTQSADAQVQRLSEDIAALGRIMSSLAQRSDEMSTALAQHTMATENASGRLQGAAAVVDQAGVNFQSRMSALIALATQEAGTLSQQAEILGSAEIKLAAISEQTQATLQNTLDKLAQTTMQASELMEQAESRISAAEETLTQATSRSQLGYGSLATRMQEVASQLDDQLEETRKTLQASEAQFAALGSSLDQQAQVVDERLLALMNRSVSSGEALAQTGTGLIKLGEELGSTLDQLTLRLADMDSSAVRNQTQLEMLDVAMRDRVQMLDDASSHMEVTQNSLSDGMVLVRDQMEELAAKLLDLSQAVSIAREAGLESSMGANLLTNEAEALQERMESVTAQLEQRQQHLKALADDTIGRLMVVGEGFTTSVQETDAAQQRLIDRAMEGERVMSGLSEITRDSTEAIERATERLAMLTSQAAADSARVAELSSQFVAQQEGVREAGQAAAMVLQLVEAQVSKASQDGVEQLNTVANKLSDQVAQMLLRLDAISSQSTQTINQLAQAAGKLHEAGSELQQMGSTVGSSLEGNGTRMMQSAIELTTAGQTLDREMRLRLENVMSSETAITAALGRIGDEMNLLDNALKSCLGRMGADSAMLVEHLANEIEQIEKLPGKMAEAQEGLMLEISKSRLEMMNLRNELAHSSLQVQSEIQMLDQTSKDLLENMEDVRAQSQMTAEQLTLAGVEMAQSTEAAWQTLRETINSGIAGLSGVKDELHGAEDNAKSSIESARRQIEALGQHLSQVADMVSRTSNETQSRYEKMAQLGQGMLADLADRLNSGADRLTQASDVAKLSFAEAVELLSTQERQIQDGSNRMVSQLLDIKSQLAAIEDGLSAVDTRMDFVAPSLDDQRGKLEQLLLSVDNTLAQVALLDERSSALATSHLSMAGEMAEQEQKLIALADLLSNKVAGFATGEAGAFMDKLQQAGAQAAEMENRIVQIAHKAVQLDAILGDVSSGLQDDVASFETYEKRLGATAEQVSGQLRQSSNELAETLQRVEKSAKVSHLTLGQTGEETQRMVVRLEQIRALLKTMMGNVSADLTKWQTDLRQQVQDVAQQVKVQMEDRPQQQVHAITRQAQQAQVAQVAAAAQNASGSVLTNNNSPFFTQLASEALHALAVDLYRLLHTDVAALRAALPESARGRGPMTPDEARAHTERLVARDGELLRNSIRELYARSTEFRQFADRYLTRFELQYDVLARAKDNLVEATRWREGPQGKLYQILTAALERASRVQPVSAS